jgi:triacylglycerol lipase
MPIELYEDAFGDPRNAHALALAAAIAYEPQPRGGELFRSEFGMEATLVASDNTQAYVAANPQHVLVAFRGSEAPTSIDGLKDWLLTDAVNLLIMPEGRLGTDFAAIGVGARFHKGFMGALAEIWDPLVAAVEAETRKVDRPLWITGHSLGGALALLATWLFKRRGIGIHQVYTYGAPMVGNAEVAQAYAREFPNRIFRYVNLQDPVPKLPTMSLIANDYLHCDKEVGLGEAGETIVALFQSMTGKAVNGLLNLTLVDEIWSYVKARIGAHDVELYKKNIGLPPKG